jgi:DNA-binding transcriptional MerR regulator
MTPKLFRAVDVCELAQLQPYVLRSWEKEFPGIGVQKDPDAQRLYRQSDLDQVLRIKQLVFSEGLTLAGARRRLEETTPKTSAEERQEVEEVLEALASDAKTRIANVRDGLRSILQMLSTSPGSVVVVDVERESASTGKAHAAGRTATVRTLTPKARAADAKGSASKRVAPKVMAKAERPVRAGKAVPASKAAAPRKVVAKGAAKKRSRASA